MECIRQLAVTQTGLFRYYERKLDERGKSLESQLMETLLDIRCNDNPTVSFFFFFFFFKYLSVEAFLFFIFLF